MNSQELRALQEAYSQVYELDENRMASRMGKMPSAPAKVGKATHSIKDIAPSKEPSSKEKAKARKALGLDEAGTATGPRLTDAYDKPPYGDDLKSNPTKKGPKMKGVVRKEETDLYDIILSHLIDEGYADTEQAAEAIMVNMSEDWRESIVEQIVYGGVKTTDTPADSKPKTMVVTAADKSGNTKAYQNFKAGDPRYSAASHLKGV
jgi:hypothetical protein